MPSILSDSLLQFLEKIYIVNENLHVFWKCYKLANLKPTMRALGGSCNLNRITVFQPSGSRHAVILVLIPGRGPGSLVIFPPQSLIASAVLYTSSVPIAICWDMYKLVN